MEKNPYKASSHEPHVPKRVAGVNRQKVFILFCAVLGAIAAGIASGNWRVAGLLGGAFSGAIIGFILASLTRALR